jgi:hypothetical protein
LNVKQVDAAVGLKTLTWKIRGTGQFLTRRPQNEAVREINLLQKVYEFYRVAQMSP